MKHLKSSSPYQKGSSLIESLIALTILLFAVLGLIALQTDMLRMSGQSKHRVEATLLAQNLMGLISVNADNAVCYATSSVNESCTSDAAKTQRTRWETEVQNKLPNATADEVTSGMQNQQNPSVVIDDDKMVTITLGWKGPTDSAVRNLIIVGKAW